MYHSIYPQINHSLQKNNCNSNHQLQPVKYPEDIQIIIRSDRHTYGNLYIGNLEAAQNPKLLESILTLIQILKSMLFCQLQKDIKSIIPKMSSDIINIFHSQNIQTLKSYHKYLVQSSFYKIQCL